MAINEAKGVYVPGLAGGRTPGKRHTPIAGGSGDSKSGGKRTRENFPDIDDGSLLDPMKYHRDAISLLCETEVPSLFD